MGKYKRLSIIIVSIIWLSGCKTIQRDVLFQTPVDYEFNTDPPAKKESYKIRVGDRIILQVSTNDGYNLIRGSLGYGIGTLGSYGKGTQNTGGFGGGYGQNYNQQSGSQYNRDQNYGGYGRGFDGYLIEPNGKGKLPIIGEINLAGLSLLEAEKKLEEKYSEFINKPYITLKIYNRRIIVLGAINTIYYLVYEQFTLPELLATLSGLPRKTAKSYNIKLIRGDLNDPIVKNIDLSTIEGMKQADLVLKSGDIVYIEPVRRVTEVISEEIGLVLGLINSVTSLILIFSVVFISK